MLVSYRLSIVTIELSLTVQSQFAIECLRRSIRQDWVTSGQNFMVFRLEYILDVVVRPTQREHPRLSNREYF